MARNQAIEAQLAAVMRKIPRNGSAWRSSRTP